MSHVGPVSPFARLETTDAFLVGPCQGVLSDSATPPWQVEVTVFRSSYLGSANGEREAAFLT